MFLSSLYSNNEVCTEGTEHYVNNVELRREFMVVIKLIKCAIFTQNSFFNSCYKTYETEKDF